MLQCCCQTHKPKWTKLQAAIDYSPSPVENVAKYTRLEMRSLSWERRNNHRPSVHAQKDCCDSVRRAHCCTSLCRLAAPVPSVDQSLRFQLCCFSETFFLSLLLRHLRIPLFFNKHPSHAAYRSCKSTLLATHARRHLRRRWRRCLQSCIVCHHALDANAHALDDC